MKISELEYKPIIQLMDLMRSTGNWSDFLRLGTFESLIMRGRCYEMTINDELIGYFLLHSYIPGLSIQEDLYILPSQRAKWATKGAFKQIRDIATSVAFDELDVEKIVGYIDENNKASRRLTSHIGMKCDGRIRNMDRYYGEWRNMMMYSMLRDEV